MSTRIEQIYCALATNSPAVMICLSIVVLYCIVYAYDVNMITKNPLVVVSVLFMAPYFTDSTNEAVLSIILSRTTWCISSNAPEGVDFCENCIMFQFLNDPSTGQ